MMELMDNGGSGTGGGCCFVVNGCLYGYVYIGVAYVI